MTDRLYFIAIIPDTTTSDEIRNFQREMAENYESKRQLKIPVHLTLIPPFKMDSSKEASLKEDLDTLASQQESFEIHLNNFGMFRQKVVYVSIKPSEELNRFQSQLASFLSDKWDEIIRIETRAFTPHITIANRDLTADYFPIAWKDFSSRTYQKKIRVQFLHLFKHDGNTWRLYHSSTLH